MRRRPRGQAGLLGNAYGELVCHHHLKLQAGTREPKDVLDISIKLEILHSERFVHPHTCMRQILLHDYAATLDPLRGVTAPRGLWCGGNRRRIYTEPL